MKTARTVVITLVATLFLSAVMVAAPNSTRNVTPDSKYRVFCANDKIEVEQRTLEQQKNARGSNVCMLGEYDTLSDAEKEAERRGGKGADCKCD